MEDGAFLDETVNNCFSEPDVAESVKGLVYQIVSGVIRRKGYFDWVLSRMLRKDVQKDIRYLLWISLYQISFMKKAHYHVVMEAVEYAKQQNGSGVANFVNAILRRFIRERDTFSYPEAPVLRLSIVHSFPEWLVKRWLKWFGVEETERLLTILNETPDFTIRIDPGKASREEVTAELEARGIETRPGRFLDSAIHVDRLAPLLSDRLFEEKVITIQDETSQLVASAVDARDGDYVLDACAGLGTKTRQLRETSPGAIFVAMDTNMKRLGLTTDTTNLVRGDGVRSPFRKDFFDVILVDAPCSSMGIIRKHPEIKWRRKEADIKRFGNYQLDLLRSLWDNLKRGGRLVYSVCSFEPEETAGVLERFRKEREFLLENPLPHLFTTECFLSLPQETGMDGFFIARLRKP